MANLVGGTLATRTRVVKLLGVGLIFLAAGLGDLSHDRRSGGGATLCGGDWPERRHRDRRVLCCLGSFVWPGRSLAGFKAPRNSRRCLLRPLGPVLMAESLARTGSYTPMFFAIACVVGMLAIAALVVPLPRPPGSATQPFASNLLGDRGTALFDAQ